MSSVRISRVPPTIQPISEIEIVLSFDEAVKLVAILGRVCYNPNVISDLYQSLPFEIKQKAREYSDSFIKQDMMFISSKHRDEVVEQGKPISSIP